MERQGKMWYDKSRKAMTLFLYNLSRATYRDLRRYIMGTYSMERLIKKYINILPIAYPHQGKEFFTIKNDILYSNAHVR